MSEPALEIVGREHELDILAEAVDAAAEGGCSLAICGEPGIGKSVLIEAAAVARSSAGISSCGRPASKPNPSCRSPGSMS
jgi:predicted ABC-type transport system involved in lysophospholipase L1 biosynthesis ATPase subunit